MRHLGFAEAHRRRPALAVVLGTNEIASAVAVHLRRAGFGVVLSHDPHPPVMRRGMSFHDALWGDPAMVEEFGAVAVERITDVFSAMFHDEAVIVTRMGLVELLALGSLDLLIDARMLKYAEIPDLRHLAVATIGLGPGFTAGVNCDRAVETRPARAGLLLTRGSTDAPDGVSSPLGGVAGERFVRAAAAGVWRTALLIGVRVYRGMILGHLDRTLVLAPMDGMLRGLVRDATEVPPRAKLIEIDPRGRHDARCTGIDERGRTIAEATAAAAADLLIEARLAAVGSATPLSPRRHR
jgi:hypothetical protein